MIINKNNNNFAIKVLHFLLKSNNRFFHRLLSIHQFFQIIINEVYDNNMSYYDKLSINFLHKDQPHA